MVLKKVTNNNKKKKKKTNAHFQNFLFQVYTNLEKFLIRRDSNFGFLASPFTAEAAVTHAFCKKNHCS